MSAPEDGLDPPAKNGDYTSENGAGRGAAFALRECPVVWGLEPFMPPRQVLLDTSFIMTLVNQHRDPWIEVKDLVKGRVRVQTLDLIVFELEHLTRMAPAATRKWAQTSLELINRKKHEIVQHKPGPTNVDVALMAHALAEREVTAIATVDREMRKILAANGIPAIWPKAKHGLLSSGF